MQRTWSVVSVDCLGTVAVNRCRPVVLESSVQSNQHFAGQWLTDVCDSRGDSRYDPRRPVGQISLAVVVQCGRSGP